MPNTIFFSWQSDRPDGGETTLVEQALDDALQRIKGDAKLEAAVRDGLETDRDTKGETGCAARCRDNL
jgi:hypothetical protein